MTSLEYVYILCFTVSVTYGELDLHKNCTEGCIDWKCLFGHCLECRVGFYQPDCDPCPETCLNRKCWREDRCTYGCERGWYGEGCDKVCEACPNDLCHQTLGICFGPTPSCPVGVCSDGCEQYCEVVEEGEKESKFAFFAEGIVPVACMVLLLFLTCCCCAIRMSRKKSKRKEEVVQGKDIEIIPFTQRRLPGTGSDDFRSSNRTFPHASFTNMYLDQTYTMLPGGAAQSQRPTPSTQVTLADIPPPPRGESPPPAYSSLFSYRGNNQSNIDTVPT